MKDTKGGSNIKRKVIKYAINIFAVLIAIVGLFSFVYPTIANYIADKNALQEINSYNSAIEQLDEKELKSKKEASQQYNSRLSSPVMEENPKKDNNQVFQNGEMIAYISIPKLKLSLPIYEGTDEGILNKGTGHVKGSSLPCGGKSTHSIIIGHSGLGTAEIFSNLEKLNNGDVFTIKYLDDTLKYKIDSIKTVKPDKVQKYTQIIEGKDYCTLMTCTPITVNTHRLIVRGVRIKEKPSQTKTVETLPTEKATTKAIERVNENGVLWIPVVIVCLCAAIVVVALCRHRRSRKHEK